MTPPPAMTSGLRALRSTSTARLSAEGDRKSTRLNSSHGYISYAVFCLKKKKKPHRALPLPPSHNALKYRGSNHWDPWRRIPRPLTPTGEHVPVRHVHGSTPLSYRPVST